MIQRAMRIGVGFLQSLDDRCGPFLLIEYHECEARKEALKMQILTALVKLKFSPFREK